MTGPACLLTGTLTVGAASADKTAEKAAAVKKTARIVNLVGGQIIGDLSGCI